MIYEKDTLNKFVIIMEPKVSFENWFGISNLPVKATFDLSEIPVEFHQPLLIALINQYNKSSCPSRSYDSHDLQKGYIGQIFDFITKIFKRN